ncbi:MAG: hypothetical protein FJ297_14960 [Planctomycetes bacterium]|nr:hypothetical protein [Planctomycetota bacterium]
MNNRMKFLLAALGVIGLATLGDQAYRRWIEGPAIRREREAAALEKQIEGAEDTILASTRYADRLAAFEGYSLPSDPELARARYQDWLLALVTRNGLLQPSVDAGQPVAVTIKDRATRKAKPAYHRYSFSLRGRGTLEQVTRLLYDFHQGGHLHKVKSLSLLPLAGGRQMDVAMSIEAIGLDRCEREGELSATRTNRLAFKELDAYRPISARNLFSQEAAGTLRDVMLTAVAFDRNGVPTAWFSLGGETPTQVATRGTVLNTPAHRIEVIDIQARLVLLDVDGSTVRITLGMTVHEALVPAGSSDGTTVTVARKDKAGP